jgi:hypothetical protein
MVHEKRTEGDPPPVSTNICNSFPAQLGAKVTFTNWVSGAVIDRVNPGDVWPFVKADGSDFCPITFPMLVNIPIYIKSTLNINQQYQFNVGGQQTCQGQVTKSVTVVSGSVELKKPA